MQDFKKLRVWQKSHELVLEIYKATRDFPDSERFGVSQQLRDAAVSISSNLAEGSSRRGDLEFRRFPYMAMGSASESECHLLLSRDFGYLERQCYERLRLRVVEVRRMLCRLSDRLSADVKRTSRN
jgi:four helix bundle protein